MGGVMNLKPTRQGSMNNIIADLDALIDEQISFKLHGKQHFISSVSTITFFKFAEKLAALNSLREKENLTGEELTNAYYDLINSVCDTITVEDVEKCTSAQIGALFQLVLDKVMGRLTDDKKKTLIQDPTLILKK